jgi:hypothetical protein
MILSKIGFLSGKSKKKTDQDHEGNASYPLFLLVFFRKGDHMSVRVSKITDRIAPVP